MIYSKIIDSPLGKIISASDGKNLSGLWYYNQKFLPDTANFIDANLEIFDQVENWLDHYFSGDNPAVNIPVNPNGTTFQKQVWHSLTEIPYGQTTNYQTIANQLNSSPRAVGGAVGHNPISIIVPCHRVLAKNGSLNGYSGGLDRKKYLLDIEKAL